MPAPRGFRLPILQGVLPIKGSQVPAALIAGLTLAALAVPEVMGLVLAVYTRYAMRERARAWEGCPVDTLLPTPVSGNLSAEHRYLYKVHY